MILSGASAYRRTRVQAAHPAQLIVQLYDGAIRFVERAIQGYEDGSLEVMHENLMRAQAVVSELRATLNRNVGPVTNDLDRMYDMLSRKLALANVRNDPNIAQEVLGYLREMLSTWQYVAQKTMGGTVPMPSNRQPGNAGRAPVR